MIYKFIIQDISYILLLIIKPFLHMYHISKLYTDMLYCNGINHGYFIFNIWFKQIALPSKGFTFMSLLDDSTSRRALFCMSTKQHRHFANEQSLDSQVDLEYIVHSILIPQIYGLWVSCILRQMSIEIRNFK